MIFKIEKLLVKSLKIAFLVGIELFAFVVICMLVNSQESNTVSHSIDLLLKGVIYG